MPIVEPRYWPAPKSACMLVLAPMKLMTAAELGSTGVEEISVFQRLSAGNGTKPPRLAPWPSDRELQLEVCGEGGGGGRLPIVAAPQPASERAKNAMLKLSILRVFAGIP